MAGLLTAWALAIDGHFVRHRVRIDPRRAEEAANQYDATWEDVSLRAVDAVRLRGWLFTPRKNNRRAVLLVHGRGGTRQQMLSRAKWLLSAGYTCLLIDQRGSGASGGIFSFGIHEPSDIVLWTKWLRNHTRAASVFGYGVSRGSTTLIRSLAAQPPLDGVAAESAGVGNIGRPYGFIGDWIGASEQTARLISWPLIEPSFAWIRLRHGLDLKGVPSGIEAIRGSGVPLLIIQGEDDRDTPLRGAERLRDANPHNVELFVIPGAGHDWFADGQPKVIRRILAWFDERAR